MSLSLASNSFMYNIFPDSRVMSRLVSNKAKNAFIAFRTKYMNISNEFHLNIPKNNLNKKMRKSNIKLSVELDNFTT